MARRETLVAASKLLHRDASMDQVKRLATRLESKVKRRQSSQLGPIETMRKERERRYNKGRPKKTRRTRATEGTTSPTEKAFSWGLGFDALDFEGAQNL